MAEPDVKKALRDEEMSRMIASFTATTPPSDHRLIGSEH